MTAQTVEPLRLVATRRQRAEMDEAADPAAVEGLIQDWPDEFLACRSGNHVWVSARVDDARTFYVITERCPRCKCTREWDMDSKTGEQFGGKRYTHPDGYLAVGVGRIGGQGRNMIRLASVKRNMPKPRKMKPAEMQAMNPHKATREALGIPEKRR